MVECHYNKYSREDFYLNNDKWCNEMYFYPIFYNAREVSWYLHIQWSIPPSILITTQKDSNPDSCKYRIVWSFSPDDENVAEDVVAVSSVVCTTAGSYYSMTGSVSEPPWCWQDEVSTNSNFILLCSPDLDGTSCYNQNVRTRTIFNSPNRYVPCLFIIYDPSDIQGMPSEKFVKYGTSIYIQNMISCIINV